MTNLFITILPLIVFLNVKNRDSYSCWSICD